MASSLRVIFAAYDENSIICTEITASEHLDFTIVKARHLPITWKENDDHAALDRVVIAYLK